LTACTVDGFASVAVKDDGVGLTAESLSSIFGMFSQVDTALERAEGGLGIGLALAKGLVELHGGTIEARSEGLGQGSEFRVCLPLASADPALDRLAQSLDAFAPPITRGRRILVADDNVDAAQSLKMLLEMAGHEVHLAHDGRQAIYLAEQYIPELAIVDIGMPKLNGYDVARSIRSTVWGRALYLIALTGWGQEDDKRRAASAGFDLHLTKPVDPDKIFEILAGLTQHMEIASLRR
jgi:CheY-like chemotaxis protein